MPSDEELRKAREEERADGWGILEGVPEEELTPPWEETLLESGQKLTHHGRAQCSGNCCLHGTSTFSSCRMPRSWRHDKGSIEHQCPHGIGHPCAAGLNHAIMTGQHHDGGVHGCDGCCYNTDGTEPPQPPMLPTHDRSHEYLIYWLKRLDNELDAVKTRVTTLSWVVVAVIVLVNLLHYFW